MTKEVKIYSLPSCPYCQELKDLLTQAGIAFTDVDVSLPQYQNEYSQIVHFSKCDELPVVRVEHQILIPEKSFRSIPEAAYLTQKFLR